MPAAPASFDFVVVLGERLGVDPAHLDVVALGPARMIERRGHRHVRVGQRDVLADQSDLELGLGRLDAFDQRPPAGQLWLVHLVLEVEEAHDEVTQTPVLELQWDLVDGLRGGGGHDRVDIDVAEEGDLLAQLIVHVVVATGDDDVGLDADAAQLLDRVLGGLGLELTGRGQRRQQCHMHVEHVVAADVLAHLADGLEERQRFDVADGAADLDDDHVR